MANSISHDTEHDIIIAIADEKSNLLDLLEMVKNTILMAKEKNCHRILTDMRAAEFDLSATEIYYLPEKISKLINDMGLKDVHFKRAFVTKENQHTLRFYETVSLNRGLPTHLFHDMDAAIDWLIK